MNICLKDMGHPLIIPPNKYNLTEEDVLRAISNVASKLSHKWKFGYHTPEDIKQQISVFALEALCKYDGCRPLENFLYIHAHNQLFNFKRNNYERPDKPCDTCPFFDKHCQVSVNQCAKYTDKTECKPYATWLTRNSSKKNLMQPTDIDNIRDEEEDNMRMYTNTDSVEQNELNVIIDKYLDIKLRADYIKLKNNIKISRQRRGEVEQAIKEILEEHYD